MNRREALAAIAAVATGALVPPGEPEWYMSRQGDAKDWQYPPRVFYLDWLRYSVVDGVARTEAVIGHNGQWPEYSILGNTIQLAPDLRLIVGPWRIELRNESGVPADLILGNSGSMTYLVEGPSAFECWDGYCKPSALA